MIEIIAAVGIDWLLGDPPDWPHPIRFIGWIIRKVESLVRKFLTNLYAGGFILLFTVIAVNVSLLLLIKLIIHPTFFKVIEIYMLYALLAARCLSDEGHKVKKCIDEGNLESSRKNFAYLVGRDTENCNEKDVIRGMVETISENTVDGILAPLIYMILGSFFGHGLTFVLIYKTVNTLDSMVGYHQPPFKEIGFASAKMDDLLNFIPARIGSILMLISGAILNFDFNRGVRTFIKDRKNHKSPNSGHPESAVAGLLGLQLGGDNTYFGVLVSKPTIGSKVNELNSGHINDAIKIMYLSEILLLISAFTINLMFGGGM
ncbi:MAG: adenosylcobinamide-phosphate synthase CbiB [Bacillota bacterium]|nr:adenosylcobinamide-phosphate synthase CbiB [Bacillota bacterium]